jgi:peptidoglycan-associated lipoprotein
LSLRNRILVPVVLLVALVAVTGCKKKVVPPPAPPPPPVVAPIAPTAQITATPTVITEGDSVELSWKTTGATAVSILGIGDVAATGTKTVSPSVSSSYQLVAKGDGGSADSSVRVTVNPKPVVVVPVQTISVEDEFKANVQDVFFDYDAYTLSADAQATLSKNASYLAGKTGINVVIGGYCDERGSNEYNLALGQKRADAAKTALVTAGVPVSRIRVLSYGKEKPFCSDSNEECWQKNRRAGFAIDK